MRLPKPPLRFLAPAAVAVFLVAPAESRAYRHQPWADARYARVTLTNQADVPVTVRYHWPHRRAERVTLRPGEHQMIETAFPAGTLQPDLTVRWEAGDRDGRREGMEVPSGHVDPYTDNPGRVYDFGRLGQRYGGVIDLRPR